MKLSLLDYAPIDEGGDAVDAMRASVRLARTAERLGYQRFWVAEHHGIDALATISPEVIMAHLAAVTDRMRIGSGGVMLPNYSAMKVAENFRQLAALSPGRIDLGVGRTSGSADPLVTRALYDDNVPTRPFDQKMDALLGFLTGGPAESADGTGGVDDADGADAADGADGADGADEAAGDYAGLRAGPVSEQVPTPFLLSAGGSTAAYAGRRGIGFTFARFINGSGRGPEAARAYREAFRPSPFLDRPHVMVAVFVVVGETGDRADAAAHAAHLWLARAASGRRSGFVPTADHAAEQVFTERERVVRERNENRLVYGTADRVVEQLLALGREFGAAEVMVNPLAPTATDRERMITALANAW